MIFVADDLSHEPVHLPRTEVLSTAFKGKDGESVTFGGVTDVQSPLEEWRFSDRGLALTTVLPRQDPWHQLIQIIPAFSTSNTKETRAPTQTS
jgi:hypothetical protein